MQRPPLEKIQRTPVYELVLERLREFIDVQRLKPGDRLMTERELAEQLGVSRTSVRQALTALKVLGMVEVRHGEGVYLTQPPSEVLPSLALEVASNEVDHPMIWEVREGIEVMAARLAARRRTLDDLSRMRDALAAMEESVKAGGDGVVGDRHFHRALASAAHNPMLASLVDQLADVMNATSEASLSRAGQPATSLKSHRAILAAIDAQDEVQAAARMAAHIAESGRSIHSA